MKKTFSLLVVVVGLFITGCKMNDENKWVMNVNAECYVENTIVKTDLCLLSNQDCDYYIMGFATGSYFAYHSNKRILNTCVAFGVNFFDIDKPVGRVYVINRESGDVWEYNIYYGTNNLEIRSLSGMMPVIMEIKEIE